MTDNRDDHNSPVHALSSMAPCSVADSVSVQLQVVPPRSSIMVFPSHSLTPCTYNAQDPPLLQAD